MQGGKKKKQGGGKRESQHTSRAAKTVTCPHPILFEAKATVKATTTQIPAKEEKMDLVDSFFFAKCAHNVKFVGKLHIT